MKYSHADARRKIDEILRDSRGDRHLAEKQVRGLADRDLQFLRALVDPFLGGIIAHALSGGRAAGTAPEAAPQKLPLAGMDGLLQSMSRNIDEPGGVKGKASHAHADTIRALAEAQARNRKADT